MVAYCTLNLEHIAIMSRRLLNECCDKSGASSLLFLDLVISSQSGTVRKVASLKMMARHASNIRACAKKLRPGSDWKNAGPVAVTALNVP